MPRWPPISGSGKKPVLIQKQTIGYSPARTRAGNIPSGQILSSRKSFVRQRSERESRWHTFRHSYSSLLVANGENVKVVQELMRHASSRVTLEVYSQARNAAKRQAQERVVQMIFPVQPEAAAPPISYGDPQPNVS